MAKTNQVPELSSFYRMPFEKGTFKLTQETLNLHSEFRKPERYYHVKIRNVNFRNEILTLGVKIKEEPEQLIYIKVTRYELLVCCNIDTDATYLSRYAYFGLITLMDYSSSANFEDYYWPDFFDSQTGKSPFLKIYNDRSGLDIELKTKYPHFYKPGDQLFDWFEVVTVPRREISDPDPLTIKSSNGAALGYFLADHRLSSIHSNHFSFLVPFVGIPTKDRQKIKSFISFLFDKKEVTTSNCAPTPTQLELNEISFKMRELAPVGPSYWRDPFRPDREEKENGNQLLELWHKAKQLLLSQPYVYYYQTYGLNYLNGKPRRSWIKPYQIQKERPQLVLKRIDKGKYYQLELKFRVNRKTLIPEKDPICFFVNSCSDPEKLYLLDQFTDFQLILFFSHFNYKIAVLKPHYQDEFKSFMEYLAKQYLIIEV
ncbi:hypothetical protein [Algoriphagus halophytocola]|uniref:Uncharacterized protein n=1 Tax=Algoriphagus halophytocola TaxID=2991499 RepID=A0ABY6MMH1_9BACT|nr:hypothetical protein [Algoriphagus sp. TR-M5]UZD24355.1 hypothetical protein OM944_07600 [Algoriphagus sp. TR-M5]